MAKRERESVNAAVGMVLIILGISVIVPGVILNLESPQNNAFSQDVDERIVITGDVSSRVTQITNQDEVNVSMFDRKSGEFNSTGELLPGETATVRLEGQDINVTVVDVFSTETAVIRYVYPLYIGWPDNASFLVEQTPIMILVAVLTLIVGLMFTIHEGMF